MSKPLLDVIRDLAYEPAEQAAFEADPAEYMAQHGYQDVPAEDMQEAIGLAADTMPANMAIAIAPQGEDDVTDSDVVETLWRVSTATESVEAEADADADFADGVDDPDALDDPADEASGPSLDDDGDPDELDNLDVNGADDVDRGDDAGADDDDFEDMDDVPADLDGDIEEIADFGTGWTEADPEDLDGFDEVAPFDLDDISDDGGLGQQAFLPHEPHDDLDASDGLDDLTDDDGGFDETDLVDHDQLHDDVMDDPPDIGAF